MRGMNCAILMAGLLIVTAGAWQLTGLNVCSSGSVCDRNCYKASGIRIEVRDEAEMLKFWIFGGWEG